MSDQRRVLVTGASSGIGEAIAHRLLADGSKVTGIARSFKSAENQIDKVELDLSDVANLEERIKSNSLLGHDFDTLILNAGYGQFGAIEQFSYQQIEELINTNLVSNLFLLKYFLPQFRKLGHADIVFVGSESAIAGAKQGSVYCASKFAVRGLSQSLRADCAGSGIRVMLINPGPVATDFFDDLNFQPENGVEYSISPESIAESVLSALAQPRNVVIEEINIQPIKRAFRKK